jgi:hypothetical protein
MMRLVSGSNSEPSPSRNGVIGTVRSRLQAGAQPVSQPPTPGLSAAVDDEGELILFWNRVSTNLNFALS